MKDAINRAKAYRRSGADAILVHSKKINSSEIELFMKEWSHRSPVVIVPTKYYNTPTSIFEDLKISMVIWANQSIRSSITAIKR